MCLIVLIRQVGDTMSTVYLVCDNIQDAKGKVRMTMKCKTREIANEAIEALPHFKFHEVIHLHYWLFKWGILDADIRKTA